MGWVTASGGLRDQSLKNPLALRRGWVCGYTFLVRPGGGRPAGGGAPARERFKGVMRVQGDLRGEIRNPPWSPCENILITSAVIPYYRHNRNVRSGPRRPKHPILHAPQKEPNPF